MTISLRRPRHGAVGRTIPANVTILICTVAIVAAWGFLHLQGVPARLHVLTGILVLFVGAGFVVRIIATSPASLGTSLWQLVSLVSPTALLMATFPVIIGDIEAIGHVMVILSVSVVVPWISAATTMPVYGQLSDVDRSDHRAFYRAFASLLPAMLVWSVIPVAVFSVVIIALLGWRPELIGFFLVGVVSNVLFAHMLIAVQETKRFGAVLLSWVFYAAALFLMPTLWFIAPLVGCLPVLFLLGKAWAGIRQPMRVDARLVARDIGYGLLYGSVLWVDKFLFIILNEGDFSIVLLYVALVPVVIAQGVYFASQYQAFQAVIDGLWSMVEKRPVGDLNRDTARSYGRCESVLSKTIAVAGFVGVGMLLISPGFGVAPTALQLALFVAPVWFLATTLMAFQLMQMKGQGAAASLCATHLVAACVLIALLDPVYAIAVIIIVDAALIGWGGRRLRTAFERSGYELFWKKALAW